MGFGAIPADVVLRSKHLFFKSGTCRQAPTLAAIFEP